MLRSSFKQSTSMWLRIKISEVTTGRDPEGHGTGPELRTDHSRIRPSFLFLSSEAFTVISSSIFRSFQLFSNDHPLTACKAYMPASSDVNHYSLMDSVPRGLKDVLYISLRNDIKRQIWIIKMQIKINITCRSTQLAKFLNKLTHD